MTPTFDKICEDILNENNVDEKSKGLWHNMNKAKKRGKVFIQTYFPNQPVIKSFIKRDREDFVKHLLLERKKFNMPPFSFMTAIIISGPSKSKTESYSSKLIKAINPESDIDILGPVEAPLFLLRGKYTYRLLQKT